MGDAAPLEGQDGCHRPLSHRLPPPHSVEGIWGQSWTSWALFQKVTVKQSIYSYRNEVSRQLSFCCGKELPDLQFIWKLPGVCGWTVTAAHCVRVGKELGQSAHVWRFWHAHISLCPQPWQSFPDCWPRHPRGRVSAYYGSAYAVLVVHGFIIFLFIFQILSANDQACTLFDCATSELIGKKLSCLLRKTSQVLEEALGQDFPLDDGTIATVTGKVVQYGNYITHSMDAFQMHFIFTKLLCHGCLCFWLSMYFFSAFLSLSVGGCGGNIWRGSSFSVHPQAATKWKDQACHDGKRGTGFSLSLLFTRCRSIFLLQVFTVLSDGSVSISPQSSIAAVCVIKYR